VGLAVVALTVVPHFAALAREAGPPASEAHGLHAQAQTAPRPAVPTAPQLPAVDPSRTPVALTHSCAPAEVITTKALVRVQCRTAVQGVKGLEEVSLFAVGVEDPAFASRVMKVAMSAQIAGYRVKITFTSTDVSGERLGCPRRNCRLIETISLLVN
jgi:hypothetical protein